MNKLEITFRNIVQRYNPKKYWKLRQRVVCQGKYPRILKYIYLFYIKRCDAFNNASLGTHIGYGATFDAPPNFPHGLYGIIVSHNAHIGKNATIFHQVTIGEGVGGAPTIGDNCYIGPGAKITGKIHIGNNVKIGPNCVVFEDIPDNSTVVLSKPRIIQKNS
ncbi:MAG: serine acetyltransferase [Ruminococcus sp.]|nr:serine acetyltransferase [Ruminococcus sp.]